mmetsp:Transcript_44203/g.104649  ORF Transcript_44203/g.104649 Transcript_44203/m.104649 type:complete len:131 (-) Transcript_44203:651-1043(-)
MNLLAEDAESETSAHSSLDEEDQRAMLEEHAELLGMAVDEMEWNCSGPPPPFFILRNAVDICMHGKTLDTRINMLHAMGTPDDMERIYNEAAGAPRSCFTDDEELWTPQVCSMFEAMKCAWFHYARNSQK